MLCRTSLARNVKACVPPLILIGGKCLYTACAGLWGLFVDLAGNTCDSSLSFSKDTVCAVSTWLCLCSDVIYQNTSTLIGQARGLALLLVLATQRPFLVAVLQRKHGTLRALPEPLVCLTVGSKSERRNEVASQVLLLLFHSLEANSKYLPIA